MDVGYVALLMILVVLPAAAVGAAVIDRIVTRRRNGTLQRPLSTGRAFPVIPVGNSKPPAGPLQVQTLPDEKPDDILKG